MPEQVLHELGVHALDEQQGGARVPEVVESYARQSRVIPSPRAGIYSPFMSSRGSTPSASASLRSSLTPISGHEDIVAAVAAGRYQVEVEDLDFSYGLFADGVKVASFAEGRIGYREWARRSGRLEDIHSIDDRYDHDIDELMA